SPVVNIVGDHATYHLKHDAPLTSDIESLARPMSRWVHAVDHADEVSAAAAEAIVQAHMGSNEVRTGSSEMRTGPGGVATLILPADAAWNEVSTPLAQVEMPTTRSRVSADRIS